MSEIPRGAYDWIPPPAAPPEVDLHHYGASSIYGRSDGPEYIDWDDCYLDGAINTCRPTTIAHSHPVALPPLPLYTTTSCLPSASSLTLYHRLSRFRYLSNLSHSSAPPLLSDIHSPSPPLISGTHSPLPLSPSSISLTLRHLSNRF